MEAQPAAQPRISLASQVLIGLAAGIAAGVFLGDLAGSLAGVGRAFILLLQMTVLPFMMVSLIVGLGRLDLRQAVAIARGGGVVLLLLWAISMAVVLAFPIAFPDWESASFFSSALVEAPAEIDFLELYIPSNPFFSLTNAIVPAIVVFSVAFGVTLITVESKGPLLDILATIQDVLERITGSVVRLAPIGVFALMASAAGTLDLGEIGRLQVYLLVYSLVALVLVLWVLPALVTTVTPLRYQEVIGPVRDALVTAFATGNLLIVLPILAREGKEILRRAGLEPEIADSSVDVLVPASFTVPNMGKLLSLAFVPFAGWFTGFELSAAQYPVFAVAGLVSFFGEPVVSLPFLLDLLRIPADTFELFITVDVIASRFGTLLAATHTLVLAVLGAFVMSGRVRPAWRRIGGFAVVSTALLIAVIVGARLFFTYAMDPQYGKYREFVELELIHEGVDVVEYDSPPAADPEPGRRLEQIRQRGSLRIGYFDDALPFVFRNVRDEIVGFDVEMAHLLARGLGVTLELVRLPRGQGLDALASGACDVLMSGIDITPERATRARFSPPVADLTLGFVVPDHERNDFSTWDEIQARADLTVAIAGARHYERLLGELMPEATIVRLPSLRDYFTGKSQGADALVTSAETGSAWTLVYPQFAVAVPQPDPIAIPIGYATPLGEPALGSYVDAFVRLMAKDGTVQMLFAHWFEGKTTTTRVRRWSVIGDVLGWVD